jgi:hypothetical protein
MCHNNHCLELARATRGTRTIQAVSMTVVIVGEVTIRFLDYVILSLSFAFILRQEGNISKDLSNKLMKHTRTYILDGDILIIVGRRRGNGRR